MANQKPLPAAINQSFRDKLDRIADTIEEATEIKLVDIAEDIVRLSPVDTGAYVNSWSFKDNPGGGRKKSGAGKPRKQDPGTQKAESLRNLALDIELAFGKGSTGGPSRAEIEFQTGRYYFLNGAAHAEKVEKLYGVKAQIENMYG
jgi:hypothetical protein